MAYLPQVSFQPYIKPYVGSANAELGDTVKVLTQRYDENLKAATDLDILAGLTASQVPEGDRAAIEGTISQIRNNIAEMGSSDSSYYAARPKLAQLASKFAGDPDIAKMKENKKIMDEAAAIRNKMVAQGMKVLDFSRGQDFKTVTVDENGQKVYNTFKPMDEMQHNYHDSQMKFFDQLQQDGSSGGLSRAAMAGFLQTSSWQGISGAKIKAQANRALSGYLGTAEGDQQFRKLTQLQGLSPEQAQQTILKEMIATGMERQNSVSQTSYQQDPMAMIEARAAAKGSKMEGYALQADAVVPIDNSENIGKVDAYFKNSKISIGSLNGEQQDIVRNAMAQAKAKLGPNASPGKIKIEAHKSIKAIEQRQVAPSYYALDGTEAINNANNTFKNGNQTALTYQLADKPGKVFNWEQLKDELGQDDVDDEKFLKGLNVSGQYAPGHPYRRGLKGSEKDRFVQPLRISISLPDGKTRTVVASSDLGSTKGGAQFDYNKLKADIYDGKETGRGKVFKFPDGNKFHLLPTGQPNPNDPDDEMIMLIDSKGKQGVLPLTTLLQQGIR